jgi:hypothetical protein
MPNAHNVDVRELYKHWKRSHSPANSMGVSPDVTDDEAAFGDLLQRYKTANGRPCPTCSEVLFVIETLGWRRVAEVGIPAEIAARLSPVKADAPVRRYVRSASSTAGRPRRGRAPRRAAS